MADGIRRVVTGHDAEGKAIVVSDDAAPNVRHRPAAKLTSTLLWVTEDTPASNAGNTDAATGDRPVPPPDNGTVFRVVDFPPEDQSQTETDASLADLTPAGGDRRHPGMHRTRSVDYAIVMSGEIDMWLDDTEVHLKAGDVVIQRGTNHAWVNRGTETCRIAFVLVDADPLDE